MRFLLVLVAPLVAISSTNYPAWWNNRNVINTNAIPNDYAPATAGQLKWMVGKAYDELQTNLPGGAGTGIAAVVSSFTASNNYAPVNLGQLKYVAKPFYDRLIEVGYTNSYPWTTNTDDDADFAPVALGQLKNVFSFDVTSDTDADSLPDWWENHWSGGVTNWVGADDADGDNLSNLEEYRWQTNPTNEDTDADGLNDGDEANVYGADPLKLDTDDDGINDGPEVSARTDPKNPDTNAPSVTLVSPTQLEVRIWIP